jgi:hypothetical protein
MILFLSCLAAECDSHCFAMVAKLDEQWQSLTELTTIFFLLITIVLLLSPVLMFAWAVHLFKSYSQCFSFPLQRTFHFLPCCWRVMFSPVLDAGKFAVSEMKALSYGSHLMLIYLFSFSSLLCPSIFRLNFLSWHDIKEWHSFLFSRQVYTLSVKGRHQLFFLLYLHNICPFILFTVSCVGAFPTVPLFTCFGVSLVCYCCETEVIFAPNFILLWAQMIPL